MYRIANHSLRHLFNDGGEYIATKFMTIRKDLAFLAKLKFKKSIYDLDYWINYEDIINMVRSIVSRETYPVKQTTFTNMAIEDIYKVEFMFACKSDHSIGLYDADILGWIIYRIDLSDYHAIEYKLTDDEAPLLLIFGDNKLLAILAGLDPEIVM